MPQLILGPVIVDGDADVVLLYELLDSRQSFRCGVTSDNDTDTSSLAVVKLCADVRIFVFRKIDSSGSMKLDACPRVVLQGSRLLLSIHREMIFNVLRI